MNANTNSILAALVVITIAAVGSGCAGAAAQLPRAHRVGDLALEVPVDSAAGPVDVMITGSDIESPVYARLGVEDGVARGLVYDVDAGDDRVMIISSQLEDGRRCAREVRLSVAQSDTTFVESGALQCEALHRAPAQSVASAERPADSFPPVL